MWYLFVVLYLFIGHLTYVHILKDEEYRILDQIVVMIIHPLIWILTLYIFIRSIYRILKGKTTADEEIENFTKKTKDGRKNHE